ncbi:MAG: phosphomannomutase/phosphoglucomutase, partial [Candidatus Paceibacterota bacterium]
MNFSDIIKSYDVRGVYPDQINEEHVRILGGAFVKYLGAKTVAVGRDCRTSSPAFHTALIAGITEQGANVIDIGEATTPMVYHAAGTLDVDGAIMITASHNPPEYNGMKFVRSGAIPIGKESGLAEISEIAEQSPFTPAEHPGDVHPIDIKTSYSDFITKYADIDGSVLTAVVDPGNMMGVLDIEILKKLSPALSVSAIFDKLDGTMPNHEANPLNKETLTDLQTEVTKQEADIGIAYDGDADRIGFVDEQGRVIQPHLITALLARHILSKNPAAAIAYDVPSSRSVNEEITKHGGTPLLTKVGTANIKSEMREQEAIFGGEFSGHYYFKDHFYSEAPTLVAILVLNMMVRENKPLSELI